MKRIKVVSLLLGLVACTAALVPIAASAALPKPKVALIVPFTSIDGIKLGVGRAKAFQAWGSQALCAKNDAGTHETCSWFARSTTDYPVESASVEIHNGTVCGLLIRGGTDRRAEKLAVTGLKNWKTTGGVGLGSKLQKAKLVLGKLVVQKRGVTTAFIAGTAGESMKQVEEITIFRNHCNVT